MTAPFDKSTSIEPDPNATLAPVDVIDSAASFLIGRAFGDFKLLEEIARGGMGVVFRASQLSLHRIVAVKMALAGQFARPEDVQRFRAEAEAAAGLDHSNILPVYEVGSVQGQPFFAMKLVEGGSLAVELKKRYPAGESSDHQTLQKKIAVLKSVFASDSVAPLVQLLVPVAKAVHFAHQRGILHRDLKPGNILLDADGTPYVTDFGLAKRVEGDASLTQTGAVVGTPSYMAPEQARAEKQLTTAVDVYSLGAILYEALTGRPPFRAATVMETIMQVLEKDPEPPSKIAPGADRDLAVIAMKCLEKEPSRRYASAAEFAAELERWLKGESIQARQVGSIRKTWRWAKRRPIMASLAAALAVLALGGTTTITRLYFQAVERRQHVLEDLNRLTAERDIAKRQLQRAEESERRATRLQYASDIALAAKLLETGDAQRAYQLLGQHRPQKGQPDLRGFEWHYLIQLPRSIMPGGSRKIEVPNRDQWPIAAGPFIFSADSRRLIGNRSSTQTQSESRLLQLDVASGAPGSVMKLANNYVCWASSRGPERLTLLVPAAKEESLKTWNTATDTLKDIPNITVDSAPNGDNWVLCPKGLSMAGQSALSPSSNIVLRDTTSQREVVLFPHRTMSQFSLLDFLPNGEVLVALDSQGNIHQWDVATGTARPINKVGIEPVGQAALDGAKRQITFLGNDGFVYQVDVATGQLTTRLSGLSTKNRALLISPDGRRLFAWLGIPNESEAISMWDFETGRELLKLSIPKGRVHALDLSPDGTRLAAHLDDGVLIWDATPMRE